MNFGQNLKRLRKKLGWSRKKLAEAVGCSTNQIYYYETGKCIPLVASAAKLARLFDISIEELVWGESEGIDEGREINKYQRCVIRTAITYRINEEIKRLSSGMKVSCDRIRKVWEEERR